METYPSGIVYNKQNNSTMKRIISFGFFFSLLSISSFAQDKNFYKPGEIYAKLQQLNTVGSVLYVAAHPDDENTQLITYFAKGKHLRTGYLSATRGDGGQNLIGIEIKEELGALMEGNSFLVERQILVIPSIQMKPSMFGIKKKFSQTLFGFIETFDLILLSQDLVKSLA
jgi:hypothetical protein